MFMVLLKTNLNPKTHVCNFAPKLVELDEGKPLAKQFREHLACDRFDTLEVNIDGRPYTIVMDADGAANSKIPSYYVSSECIIFGDILFGHRNANYEIVGVEEKDAVFLAMHLLENTSRMNDQTARLTEEQLELSEDEKAVIDGKLQMIRAHIKEHPEVTVTYFQPDEKKNGGAYVTVTGFAKKIDTFERVLMINDEISIPIGCIISLML